MSKRLILIQLPILTQDVSYLMDFLPFSIGSLASYVKTYLSKWEVLIPPIEVLAFSGDEFIIDWILDKKPDVVGFSSFLWNVERNIHIAKKIKLFSPETIIIFGGPEITKDNSFLLNHRPFDIGIIGEGEFILVQILERLSFSKYIEDLIEVPNLIIWNKELNRYICSKFTSAKKIIHLPPSPYTNNVLGPSFSKRFFIETTRGCLNRCAYCFYHRNLSGLITFPLNRIKEELIWALENEIEEGIFVDPSFIKNPNIKEVLKIIKEINKDKKISFFCETNAEDCDPWIVSELREAGFTKVEVGLQTVNKRSLRKVNRYFDEKKFIRGVKELKRSGIEVWLDIIVGLPEDTLEDVKRSVDFVVEKELFDELNLYPLYVLPGTKLREEASHFSISFVNRPPYVVYSTKFMQPEDFFYAFEYAEEITQRDFFPCFMPIVKKHDFLSYFEIKDLSLFEIDVKKKRDFSNVISLELQDINWKKKKEKIRCINEELIKKNPYILINWIIPWEFVKGIDKSDILVFFPNRLLWIDLEIFSTASYQSTQLFLKVELNGCFSLIRVPYNLEHYLTFSDIIEKQNTIWILLSKQDSRLENKSLEVIDEISFLREHRYFKIVP